MADNPENESTGFPSVASDAPVADSAENDDNQTTFTWDVDTSGEVYTISRRDQAEFLRDKYVLGEVLGEGSFATVRDAIDFRTLRRVAVKTVRLKRHPFYQMNAFNRDDEETPPPPIVVTPTNGEVLRTTKPNKKGLSLILHEVRVIRKLEHHRNIIKVLDVFDNESDAAAKDKFLWIVLEYCAASVDEVIKSHPDGKLPIWQSHLYFAQLIEGVSYMHSRNFVHCDIKPANLMVNNDNCLKITDFGTTVELSQFEKDSEFGVFWQGSPYYQSPEYFADNDDLEAPPARNSGFAIDIWACGITLYYFVTGVENAFLEAENSNPNKLDFGKRVADPTSTYTPHPAIFKSPGLKEFLDLVLMKDASKRATLNFKERDIRHQYWFRLKMKYLESADIPPRILTREGKGVVHRGDRYRSLTVTPMLHDYHHPLKDDQKTIKVPDPEYDEAQRRKKTPIVRANRSLAPRRSPPPED